MEGDSWFFAVPLFDHDNLHLGSDAYPSKIDLRLTGARAIVTFWGSERLELSLNPASSSPISESFF